MKFDNEVNILLNLPKEKCLFTKNIENFKTGDLIFSRILGTYISHTFYPSALYRHVSMIYKKDNRLYLIEMNREIFFYDNDTNKVYRDSDFCSHDMILRLNNYPGLHTWMPLNKPLNKNMLKYIDDLVENKAKNMYFPNDFDLVLHTVYNNKFKDNRLVCYTFIYYILVNIDLITDKKIKSKNIKNIVNLFNNINTMELNYDYKYLEKRQLIIDAYYRNNELIII